MMEEDNIAQPFTGPDSDLALVLFDTVEADALALLDLVDSYLESTAYKRDG